MANVYFHSIPVSEKQTARTLGSGSAWEVLEELRSVGIDGLTVDEVCKRVDLPKSTVYAILSKLQAAGWVESRRPKKKLGRPGEAAREERRRTGKMKQVYVEKIPWPSFELDEEFAEIIMPVVRKVLHEKEATFSDWMTKILDSIANDENGKKFLPSEERCSKCDESHEAIEFAAALGTGIINYLLWNKTMETVYKSHKLNLEVE